MHYVLVIFFSVVSSFGVGTTSQTVGPFVTIQECQKAGQAVVSQQVGRHGKTLEDWNRSWDRDLAVRITYSCVQVQESNQEDKK